MRKIEKNVYSKADLVVAITDAVIFPAKSITSETLYNNYLHTCTGCKGYRWNGNYPVFQDSVRQFCEFSLG
jgi:hypothetical protein